MKNSIYKLGLIIGILLGSGASLAAPEAVRKVESFKTADGPVELEIFAQNFDIIWGFDFLPESADIVFTERPGRMKIYRGGQASKIKFEEVQGLPPIVAKGQGGLLDVRVHPEFKTNALIFFTYTEDKASGELTTVLARAELRGARLEKLAKIMVTEAWSDETIHFGSRIEFDGPERLWITIGDRNERKRVQDLASHTGKILRLNLDGTPAAGNPFAGKKEARPEIYSLGHRSAQGLSRDPITGELWLAEMGPRGGDEVNLIQPGKNYGWPDVTYGREYYGPRIGQTEKAGTEQPVKYWVPSISPSGMIVYQGEAFPKWKGNLFLANLSGQHLRRLAMKDGKVAIEEVWLKEKSWRFRGLRAGPGGEIYFSTDDGKLGRIRPLAKAAHN